MPLNRSTDGLRKRLFDVGASRLPFIMEVTKFRHIRRANFTSALLAELASVQADRRSLILARGGSDVCWQGGEQDEPLVSIRIATRDRPELLVERALKTALSQTYERIEVVVVGDACDDRTEKAIRKVGDSRVKYFNLSRSGVYPIDPSRRWLVAGIKPMNVAVSLSSGGWIAPCDDDDEFTEDHVEVLLRHARNQRLELVWSRSLKIDPETGVETLVGAELFGEGCTTHGAIMYSSGLTFIEYSSNSATLGEPADWNLIKRMRLAGARVGYVDEITYRYFSGHDLGRQPRFRGGPDGVRIPPR